jgi:hypothetical protein
VVRVKDPLQQEPTAYDILQLGQDATEADVDAAYRAARQQGSNTRQLTRAWQELKRPADRAFCDLLRYDTDSLRALTPSPLDDPGILQFPAREATAAAWEKQLRASYPDYRTVHSLAVLWYWWALHESDPATHPARTCDAGNPPDPLALWAAAAACWAMLAASDEFWAARPRVSQDLAAKLAERMEQLLRDRFDSLAMEHAGHEGAAEAERYRSLDLTFTTELRTARALADSGIRVRGSPVCSGPVLLEQLGLRDEVAHELDAALARAPGETGLRRARDALSPYGQISALLEERQAGKALDQITALPLQVRGTDEVAWLEARALITLGSQYHELGRIDDAINHWAQALRAAPGQEQRETAREAIVNAARERAAALPEEDNDQAIALLEKSHEITADPALRSILAERLVRRGITAIKHAAEAPRRRPPARKPARDRYQRTEQAAGAAPVTETVIKELERGMNDLERAAELGSARAAGQLEPARGVIAQIRVKDVTDAAIRAAKRADWDTAVARLRSAVQTLGRQAPQELRQDLATALANQADTNAGRAVKLFTSAREAAARPHLPTALSVVRARYEEQLQAQMQALWQQERQAKRTARRRRRKRYAQVALPLMLLLGWLAFTHKEIAHAFAVALGIFGWTLFWILIDWDSSIGLISDIAGFFKKRFKSPDVPAGGYYNMSWNRCEVCYTEAAHRSLLGATPLCESHEQEVQLAAISISGWRPGPDLAGQLDVVLAGSERALHEAATLAPELDGVKESLRQFGELRSRMGLPSRR